MQELSSEIFLAYITQVIRLECPFWPLKSNLLIKIQGCLLRGKTNTKILAQFMWRSSASLSDFRQSWIAGALAVVWTRRERLSIHGERLGLLRMVAGWDRVKKEQNTKHKKSNSWKIHKTATDYSILCCLFLFPPSVLSLSLWIAQFCTNTAVLCLLKW